MMDISIPYYSDNTRVSNSTIGWFLNKGPAYFHKRLNGEIDEESTAAMEKGTAIHMSLLQPEEFQKTYKVWTGNKPQSDKQEAFCRELANTLEIEPNRAVLSAFMKVYSTVNQTEEKMLSKGLEIASTLKEYIEYLKNPEYEMLSPYMYAKIQTIRENINSHKLAKELLNPTVGETHHEFHINWEYRDVKCKSLLDSVNFDFENKVVTLMDLKTTTKLWHFEDSITQYDYFRQLCFYKMALEWYLVNEREVKDISEWQFKYYIIGIDSIDTCEIRVFEITQEQVESKIDTICPTLLAIKWHTENNLWEHSMSYYLNDGAELLNL